jgi:hypothetical protein
MDEGSEHNGGTAVARVGPGSGGAAGGKGSKIGIGGIGRGDK